AKITPVQEVPDERSRLRGIDDADAAVRPPDGNRRIRRIVEEQPVPTTRHEQRHTDIRARTMADVCVPELTRDTKAIETSAALPPARRRRGGRRRRCSREAPSAPPDRRSSRLTCRPRQAHGPATRRMNRETRYATARSRSAPGGPASPAAAVLRPRSETA